jgi:RimJ/RimL family protein N-acetyltransferase
MHSRQGAPQGRLGAGGAPASARTSPAPRSDALGSAADPAEQATLRDGVTVLLRPVRVDDAAATRFLFQGLSERSTWLRFFTVCPRLDRVIDWATKVDNDRRLGVVAYDADTGRLIAHAGLERDPRQPDRAEFALVVADHYQGCGLGGMLLGRLVEAAQRVGIRWLTAEVLAENHRMLNLLRHSHHPVSLRLSYGVVLAELPTSPSPGTGLVPSRALGPGDCQSSCGPRTHTGHLVAAGDRQQDLTPTAPGRVVAVAATAWLARPVWTGRRLERRSRHGTTPLRLPGR